MSHTQPNSIEAVLQAWEDELDRGTSTVGSLLRAAGNRAAGPLLFLPALVMVSPVGAIPGVPVVLCTLIMLVAGQVIAGAASLWLPGFLIKRRLPEQRVRGMIDWLRPYAVRVDRVIGQRLSVLTGGLMTRLVAALCVLLAVLVYPLTLVPFAVALPGGAIMLLSLGLLTRDGIVTLAGLMLTGAALWAAATVLFQ